MTSKIKGFKVAMRTQAVTHLFFSNDNFLFFRATGGDFHSILNSLDTYDKAFRQSFILEKSGLIYSCNMDKRVK